MKRIATNRLRRFAPGRNGNGSPILELALKSLADPAFFKYGGLKFANDVEPLKDAYSQVAAVYACILARARPLAMCPVKVFTKDSEGGYEEAKSSPFDHLLYRPNPLMSRYQLLESWEISICRRGNAFLLMDRDAPSAVPRAIWPLDPTLMKPVKNNQGLPVAWEYTPGGKAGKIRYELWQIIHDKLVDPDNPLMGRSPLDAARLDIQQEWDVSRWNRSYLENGCDPGGRYELTEGGSMDPEQAGEILRNHGDKHQGPSRVGEPMVDMGGLRWKSNDIPHKDMSFEAQRDFNLRAIKMVLGVPTVALGFEEDIPYAGAKAQMQMFWTNTLIPRIRSIEDVLWAYLCEGVEGGKYEILFDLNDVEALRDDIAEKIGAVGPLWAVGTPAAEINRALDLGLEKWEGWENSYIPNSSTQANSGAGENPGAVKSAKEIVEFQDFSLEEIEEAKSWDRKVLRPNEKKFQGKIRSWFFEHRNEVLERFSKLTGWEKGGPDGEQKADDDPARPFDIDEIFPPESSFNEWAGTALEPIYRKSILDGAEFGANMIGTEVQVTQIRGELARWLKENCLDKVTQIENTLRAQLKDSLRVGLEEGESLYGLAGRIKQIHRNAQSRSMTIARTEVARAANHGQMTEFEESGVVDGSRWNAAMDGSTRPSHRALHRKTAPMGGTFTSPVTGAVLKYPGDPNGPAEEVCNCRCYLRPILSKE